MTSVLALQKLAFSDDIAAVSDISICCAGSTNSLENCCNTHLTRTTPPQTQ